MARAGPRKVRAYSLEFKLTAVRLSQQPFRACPVTAACRLAGACILKEVVELCGSEPVARS